MLNAITWPFTEMNANADVPGMVLLEGKSGPIVMEAGFCIFCTAHWISCRDMHTVSLDHNPTSWCRIEVQQAEEVLSACLAVRKIIIQ